MQRKRGFTLIELLVVISIIGLLIGILLPALGTARNTARQMQGSTQVRGIQQGMVVFAQGNNSRYPGVTAVGGYTTATDNPHGTLTGQNVEARFAIMFGNNLFPGAYMLSPSETDGTKVTFNSSLPTLLPVHYSYAMLDISANGDQRFTEWSDTTNAESIAVSDRINGSGPSNFNVGNRASYDSIHASAGWRGSVGWNDNHVTFITIPTAGNTNITTRYGNNITNNTENLFDNTANNAKMIGRGTNVVPN